jgi:site-specific DNA-adenine methylase
MYEADRLIAQIHLHPCIKDKDYKEVFMGGGAVGLGNGIIIGAFV